MSNDSSSADGCKLYLNMIFFGTKADRMAYLSWYDGNISQATAWQVERIKKNGNEEWVTN